MQVSSFVAPSECGSDDRPAADLALHSQQLRLANRSLTRLRLSFGVDHARTFLLVHKDADYEVGIGEKVEMLRTLMMVLIPECSVYVNSYPEGAVIDCVITLGGDGTVLQAAWLFQTVVPPMLSFNLGTLGFLTNFRYTDNEQELLDTLSFVLLADSIKPGIERPRILLRMRLSCQIDNQQVFNVLNEVSVERSVAGMLTILDVIVDGRVLTTATADGLIIATPTGSTAYSLSAGGSVIHPVVPCILITPVCPHSLSFRPLLLPDTAHIQIRSHSRSRANAVVCMDGGRHRHELEPGQAITIWASPFPVPTVCRRDQSDDWFDGLGACFKWAVP